MLEERKVQKSKISLMRSPNFALLSGVMMVGKTKVVENLRTACTNGRDESYGRAFVKGLRDQELNFVVAHENYHKMYRHLTTWRKLHDIDHKVANKACDYVINLQLQDLDPNGVLVAMPRYKDGKVMGLVDERFRGMNAKEVFDILMKEKEEGGGGGSDEPDNGDPEFDDHDWDGAEELTAEEKEEIAKEIEGALRQGSILAGKMGGNVNRDIQDLLTPKVNWRDALRDFVKTATQGKDQTTWRRLHKRYIGMDIIMPSSYDEKVGSILLGIDTSGSIGGEELAQFLGEVKSICDEVSPEQIDLLYWDTRVAGHEVYKGAELASLVEVTQAKGGGGTEPACVPHYIKKKQLNPECVIMLTDGYIGRQSPDDWQIGKPILWCIKGNTHFSGDDVVGKVVHVE